MGYALKDLNLVPKSYILQRRKKVKRIYTFVIVSLMTGFLAISITIPALMKYSLNQKLAVLELKVKQSLRYREINAQFNTVLDIFKSREEEGKRLSDTGIQPLLVIRELEKCVPESLYIKSFSYYNDVSKNFTVSLNGISESEENVAKFVKNINKNDMFTKVRINSINLIYTQSVVINPDNSIKSEKIDQLKNLEIKQKEGFRSSRYSFDILVYHENGE